MNFLVVFKERIVIEENIESFSSGNVPLLPQDSDEDVRQFQGVFTSFWVIGDESVALV